MGNYPHLDPSPVQTSRSLCESPEDGKEEFAGERNQPVKYAQAVTVPLRANHGREGEKQAMTKNDRAERMSQQLWGHHWHEMMGDCFAFRSKSTLEDTVHSCSSLAQPLVLTFKVLILEHLC